MSKNTNELNNLIKNMDEVLSLINETESSNLNEETIKLITQKGNILKGKLSKYLDTKK